MRINAHQLVQRVDDSVVMVDESSGAEIVFKSIDVERVRSALVILTPFVTARWEECPGCRGQAEVIFNPSGDPQNDQSDPCPNPKCQDGYVLSERKPPAW